MNSTICSYGNAFGLNVDVLREECRGDEREFKNSELKEGENVFKKEFNGMWFREGEKKVTELFIEDREF
jgi:hypothetical protein